MSPHTPPSHSQAPRAPYSEAASSLAQRPPLATRPSSYSSLEQALVHPVQTRDSNTDRRRHPPSRDPSRQLPAMSSDGRYIYQSSPDVPPQYGYAQYAPYDPAQYPPSSSRPARNNTNPPHPNAPQPPPQPAAYAPPPPGYPQQPYPPASPYGVAPSNAPQWPTESWPQYAQPPFVPANPPAQDQQPQQQQPPPPPFARPDTHPHAPGEAGSAPAPAPPGPANPDGRRAEERPEPAPGAKARKGKDVEGAPLSPVAASLDYSRLVESYQVILESANVIAMGGGAGRGEGVVESVEHMLRAAVQNHALLDAAVQRASAEAAHAASGGERPPEGSEGSAGKARQLSISRPEQPVESGQTCLGCNATSTPEWRRGPLGPRTLCNACGLVYAKLIKKRTREPGRSRGPGQSKRGGQGGPDALSSGEDGSDEDSNGSQDRRSDAGDAARR